MCTHDSCISHSFRVDFFSVIDIVGFTEWSGSREPADVFLLLGTLYGAFDKIAMKRGVFKVETIGDCYLAGTYLHSCSRGIDVCVCFSTHRIKTVRPFLNYFLFIFPTKFLKQLLVYRIHKKTMRCV